MSYARFGEHGSHVYVFENWSRGLVCCGCALDDGYPGTFNTDDTNTFLAHLRRHSESGHIVTQRTRDLVRSRSQWFGRESLNVLRRIEQCQRMIEAHKACAERVRLADVRRFSGQLGQIKILKPTLKEEWRSVDRYYRAIPHVASAMRFLGVKL